MKQRTLIVGIALGMLLVATFGNAEARQRHVRDQFSGTTASHPTDENGDGITASLFTGIEYGTAGRFTVQGISEVLAPLPAPVTCPVDTLECPLLYSRAVLIHQASGDQLHVTFTSGILCFNPTTGAYTFTGEGAYAGGTGRFTSATGTFAVTQSGTTLAADAAEHAFGAATGATTGTLILP
jgi:hypothetical protein